MSPPRQLSHARENAGPATRPTVAPDATRTETSPSSTARPRQPATVSNASQARALTTPGNQVIELAPITIVGRQPSATPNQPAVAPTPQQGEEGRPRAEGGETRDEDAPPQARDGDRAGDDADTTSATAEDNSSPTPTTNSNRQSGAGETDGSHAMAENNTGPIGPLVEPAAPTLAFFPISQSFDAPASVNRSKLSSALKKSPEGQAASREDTNKTTEDDKNKGEDLGKKHQKTLIKALGLADTSYTSAMQKISQKHMEAMNERNQALQTLALEYQFASQNTLAEYRRSDDEIETQFIYARDTIDAAGLNAHDAIMHAYYQTRRQLGGTAARARQAVAQNAGTAQTQITQIVTDLSSSFTEHIDNASRDCSNLSREATTALGRWKRSLYPDSGGGMERARNEAKRLAGESGVDTATPRIGTQTTQIETNFCTSRQGVVADIRANVYPTLNVRAQAIVTEGVQKVDEAINSAFSSLRRQMRQATEHVEQIQTAAQTQLRQQRLLLRTQLTQGLHHSLSNNHHQVQRAMTGLIEATDVLLPRYSDTTRRLIDSLMNAANGGPSALAGNAENLAQAVLGQIEVAHQLQHRQTDTVQAGVVNGLRQSQQGIQQQLQEMVAGAVQQSTETSTTISASLMNAAQSMTAGFSSVGNGVQTTADNWSRSLATCFSAYLASQQRALNQSLPQFRTQIDTSKNQFLDLVRPYTTPASHFGDVLTAAERQVGEKIETAQSNLVAAMDAGIFDRIDEGGVTGSVRGLTAAQGAGLRERWGTTTPPNMVYRVRAYHRRHGRRNDNSYNLQIHLAIELSEGSSDYNAAVQYLSGNTAAGARHELEASLHWYNDEEARIESTMRILSDDQRRELHALDGWQETSADVRSALDGTDLNVFNELDQGNHARADLLRMLDRTEHDRQHGSGANGAADALNDTLTEYSRAPTAESWGGQTVTDEDRRQQMQAEYARMRGIDLAAIQRDHADIHNEQEAAAYALFSHVTRDIQRQQHVDRGHTVTITLSVDGPQRDLARALIFHGEGAPETRAAALGVEQQRRGGPDIVRLDRALIDERLNPNTEYPNAARREEMRDTALAERQRVMDIFARDYGGSAEQTGSSPDREETPEQILTRQLRTAFGDDSAGAFLAQRLVEQDYPSPDTAARAMAYAVDGAGTNNELIDRVMPRMNRDEIARMRERYQLNTGRDLYSDLGVHGQGWFGDLSGDDRLRFERQSLGRPRNDRERAELAAFSIRQQREETGFIGQALASGSLRALQMDRTEADLTRQMGGTLTFGPDGTPTWTNSGNFDESGQFTGDSTEFAATLVGARLDSANYAGKIDQFANAAAMGIAIVGAIAAAVASVVTGGAASPLLMASIAGITGLTAMGAQRAISGGRYGWEQASVDLGMTAVQALTAGLGQSLALASRGGSAGLQAGMRTGMSVNAAQRLAAQQGAQRVLGDMGRLTGNAFMDKLAIGMISGGFASVGQTALDENTWARGGESAGETLFAGLIRGIVTGGVTAGVTNALEDSHIPGLTRMLGGRTLGDTMGQTTNVLGRSVAKGVTSGIGGAAARGAELEFERSRGHYRGDAGDTFVSMAGAGLQQTVQGLAEGGFEARAQSYYNNRQADAARQQTDTQPTRTSGPPDAEGPARLQPTSILGAAEGDSAIPVPRIDPAALDTPAAAAPRVTVPDSQEPAHTSPIAPTRTSRGSGAPESTEPSRTPVPTADDPTTRLPNTDDLGPTRARVQTPDEDLPQPARQRARDGNEDGEESNTESQSQRSRTGEEQGAERDDSTRRPAGTAAAIADSEMQLAPSRLITTPEQAEGALVNALGDIAASGSRLVRMTVHPGQQGPERLATVQRADGSEMIVRLRVGDTEAGHVASFRTAGADAEEAFVVTLSNKARDGVHARALSHELSELSVFGLHQHAADSDLLRPGARAVVEGGGASQARASSDTPQLSPHDRGRLAELELLTTQLQRTPQDTPDGQSARQKLETEIDTLTAHLGLSHGDGEDIRLSAAVRALGEDSAAVTEINAARERAQQGSLENALAPARNLPDDARLSPGDRRSLAALDELAARLAIENDPTARRQLSGEVDDLIHRLGLADTDATTEARVRLALSGLEPDSEGARLIPQRRQALADAQAKSQQGSSIDRLIRALGLGDGSPDLSTSSNDALRPGLKPDPQTVMSEADTRRLSDLSERLNELEALRASGTENPETLARLHHDAERLASAMGLVHGNGAAGRRQFAFDSLGLDDAGRARIGAFADSVKQSPLLQPRMGTVEDLPLIQRQVDKAIAMGDHETANRLLEIAGFRLEDAGLFDSDLQTPDALRAFIDNTFGDDAQTRAFVEDVAIRQQARRDAVRLEAEADSLRVGEYTRADKVRRAQEAAEPEFGRQRPTKERIRDALETEHGPEITRLQQEQAALRSQAQEQARIAFRPIGSSIDDASAAVPGDKRFRLTPLEQTDPDFPGNPTQQRLTRERYGDSPEFQSWDRFRDLYFGRNASVREHQQATGIRSTGETRAYGADELARVFGYWRSGSHVDPDTGQHRSLSDLERIRARGAEDVFQDDPHSPTRRVQGDQETSVRIDTSDAQVSDEAAARREARASGKILVSEAETQRNAARDERQQLADQHDSATDPQERARLRDQIKRLDLEINDLSEALGVAAGRRFGGTIVDEAGLVELHGPKVPDLMHVDEQTKRVTVIECKGGTSSLGERSATVAGRKVMAEQATPENLRSLATDMLSDTRSDVRRMGRQLLAALNSVPPNVDMYVVRQPISETGTLEPMDVRRYPITRDGR